MRRLAVLVALLGALLAPALAWAHPLGNFSVNHYTRAELSGGGLYLRYVLDMAEIPAFREQARVDDAGGLAPYAKAQARRLAPALVVTVDGRRLPAVPVSQVAERRPGQAGLSLLRLSAWYRVPGAADVAPGTHRLVVRDLTFAGRRGWSEVVVRTSDGARAAGAGAAAADRSDELRSYPTGPPLDVREAAVHWTPGSGAGSVAGRLDDPASAPGESGEGGLAGLVKGDLSVGVVLLALALAMGWGALHSLSPGHGKSMVAAYLVGTRGTARHAMLLGAFVTITHTAGVIALGLVTLLASAYVLPEDLFPWLTLAAALMVLAVGGWALWGRARRALAARAHARAHRTGAAHHHDHHHRHHGHGHDHHHHHGPGGHTHAPPSDLSMRSLMVVGASAGIIPCPSALVLLLGAISLHRVPYGLVLVLAFSVGLAGVLSLIGLLVLRARSLVDRLPLDGRLAAAVPVASAMVIVGLGVLLTARAVPAVL